MRKKNFSECAQMKRRRVEEQKKKLEENERFER
jgi:hypothetical protein